VGINRRLAAHERNTMTSKLTTKQAIEQVMHGSRKPMTVTQITDAALPLTALKGKTPKQDFYSVLYSENRKPDGLVTRVDTGRFKLNPKRAQAARA
jgi:hypothetical protein